MLYRLWVLGSSDPEMTLIGKILTEANECIAYAMKNGKRVTTGNAYKATGISTDVTFCNVMVLVECELTEGSGPKWITCHRVDHHRPSDKGYNRPPEEYLESSSIGQVLSLLHSWFVDIPLTTEIRFTAAADHCLPAAYRGECPGVNPDHLMSWRLESRAAFQRRTITDVLSDINAARKALRDSQKVHFVGSDNRRYDVADFGNDTIPELPEAAAREGIPFFATVTDPGMRRKRILQCAPPALVTAWLEIAQTYLKDIYGDPSRGFAGGYFD